MRNSDMALILRVKEGIRKYSIFSKIFTKPKLFNQQFYVDYESENRFKIFHKVFT